MVIRFFKNHHHKWRRVRSGIRGLGLVSGSGKTVMSLRLGPRCSGPSMSSRWAVGATGCGRVLYTRVVFRQVFISVARAKLSLSALSEARSLRVT